MSKVVSMFNEKVKLVSENEFTKHHRYEEKDIDCYLSKAYDEETEKHFLVASIPRIPELNAMHIQYPMVFDTQEERDEFFKSYNALDFLEYLLEQMEAQIEAAKEEAEKNKTDAVGDIQITFDEEIDLLKNTELGYLDLKEDEEK